MVYTPKGVFPHAASRGQAFAHCQRFLIAATRRCGGRVSVLLWLNTLIRSATRHRLGALLPHQQPDRPQAPPLASSYALSNPALIPAMSCVVYSHILGLILILKRAMSCTHQPITKIGAGLDMEDYPRFPGVILHHRVGSYVLLSRPPLPRFSPKRGWDVRLAYLKHAASVYPEPGSNS